jgi:SAM-dependent methyltransferase
MSKKNKGKDKKAKRRAKKPKMAELADRHVLYQQSVQDPEAEVYCFDRLFKKYRKRRPLSMKEDFSGTCHLSSEWVRSHKKRTAICVDLEPEVLAYARKHNISQLKPKAQSRIELVQANVLDIKAPKVDIVCALNFSYCIFKTRRELTSYFRVAHQSLNDDGLFICELFGGTEAIVELEEMREQKGFRYVWEQESYNPITNEIMCHIHFDFPDDSRMEKAFTYDWRLWSIPEIREQLMDAGFSSVDIWWDPVEGDERGDEWYRKTTEEENQEGWLVYILATP